MSVIHFFYQKPLKSLRNREKLKQFLQKTSVSGKRRIEQLNIVFCDDAYLLQINKQYLNHNFYTDIITFDLSGKDSPMNAELYISTERVKENAQALNLSFQHELHRVIFHGLLHLLGYKDKSLAEEKAMRMAEDKLLNRYFSK